MPLLVAGTPSPVNDAPPFPAIVLSMPVVASTRRILLLVASLIRTLPE